MADPGPRLTITSGIHQGGLFFQRLLGLLTLLGPLLLVVAGVRLLRGEVHDARQILKDLPVFIPWTLILGAFAFWRHRVVLDRDAGTIVHTWGYPGIPVGRKTYPLKDFRVDDRPVEAPPGVRRRISGRVQLTNGNDTVRLRLFTYDLHAWQLMRRVGDFLGKPPALPEPAPKIYSYVISRIGIHLSAVAGVLAGMALFFVLLGMLGPHLPASAGWRVAIVLSLFAACPTLCAALLSSWAMFVPVGCPRCGGRARLRWSDGFFGYFHYECADCASSWRPGSGDGFAG